MHRPRVLAAALLVLAGCGSAAAPGATSAPRSSGPADEEQLVLVHVVGKPDVDALFDLEDRLDAALHDAEAGALDGDELGAGDADVYLYGADAAAVLAAVEPELRAARLAHGSYALVGANLPSERRVPL